MEQLIVVSVVAVAVCALALWQIRKVAVRSIDFAEKMTEEYSERCNSIARQTTEFVQANLRQVTDRMLSSVDISLEARRLENDSQRQRTFAPPLPATEVPANKIAESMRPEFDMVETGTENAFG